MLRNTHYFRMRLKNHCCHDVTAFADFIFDESREVLKHLVDMDQTAAQFDEDNCKNGIFNDINDVCNEILKYCVEKGEVRRFMDLEKNRNETELSFLMQMIVSGFVHIQEGILQIQL